MRRAAVIRFVVYCTIVLIAHPRTALGARVLGIDVSTWQDSVSWSSVKSAGRDFAWTRASYGGGTYVDDTFVANMNNGTAAGVLMGAYHYAYPQFNSPSVEAQHFLDAAGSYIGAGYLRPVVDIEEAGGTVPVGATSLSNWTNTFIDYVVAHSTWGAAAEPLIYCNSNYASNYLNSSVASRDAWIANWDWSDSYALDTTHNPSKGVFNSWAFWQYSSTGSVGGESPVDKDVANGDITFVRSFLIAGDPEQFDVNGTTAGSGVINNGSYTWESAKYSSSAAGVDPVSWAEGNFLRLAAGTDAGTSNYTITANNNHTVAGMYLQTGGGGTVTINGPGVLTIPSGDQGMYVDTTSQNLKINAVVAGSGRLVWQGDGIGAGGSLFLLGNNTYTGGTFLNSGSGVNFNNNNSFGTGPITWNVAQQVFANDVAAGPVTIANPMMTRAASTLVYVGPAAAPVTFSGAWTVPAGTSTLRIGNSTHTTSKMIISGAISGSGGALAKTGEGTLVLSGTNTYDGGTTITVGTLQLGNGGTTGKLSTTGAITNNSSLVFNQTDTVTQGTDFGSGAITGSGTLTQAGSGTLVLNAANTYTGATTITTGTLQLGSGGSAGKLSTSSAIINNSGLVFNQTDTVTQGIDFSSGAISGSGTLTQTGSGTVVLSAANTYTGKTFVNAGTLSVSSDGNLGTAPGSAVADQLTVNGGTLKVTAGFAMNSRRGITINGSGATFNVTSGSLGVSSTITNTSGSTVTITGGGDFNPSANSASTFTNGKWSITGGSRWVNANNDNNSGAVPGLPVAAFFTFDNGTYVSNSGHMLAANKGITLAAGGGTIDTSVGNMTFNGVITGIGSLTKISANSLTLGGANTYAGATNLNAGTLIVSGALAKLGSGNVNVLGTTADTSLVIQTGVEGAVNDGATFSLAGGGTVGLADQGYANLGAGTIEIVGSLLLGGVSQAPGLTYGSTSSGAVVQSDEYFAGTGILSVGVPGDFNGNGSVNVSDYVGWRKNPSTFGGNTGYELWRSDFGNVLSAGSAPPDSLSQVTVPEPGSIALFLVGAAITRLRARRQH